jgi:hypothetical protein
MISKIQYLYVARLIPWDLAQLELPKIMALHFCLAPLKIWGQIKLGHSAITNCNMIVKRFPRGECHLAAFSKLAAKRKLHDIQSRSCGIEQMTRQAPIF